MTDLREAAQMALDALEHLQTDIEWQYKSPTRAMLRKVEKALRAALAQPEQKPVAWLYRTNNTWEHVSFVEPPDDAYDEGSLRPVYTAPPQREWQGLTDEERQECLYSDPIFGMAASTFARAIEAKLKEKNA